LGIVFTGEHAAYLKQIAPDHRALSILNLWFADQTLAQLLADHSEGNNFGVQRRINHSEYEPQLSRSRFDPQRHHQERLYKLVRYR
jgi:hypothetical protein